MRGRRGCVVGCAAAAQLAGVMPAAAHAFGERYDLPLPLWLYLSAAGAAVALTFGFVAAFASNPVRRPPSLQAEPSVPRADPWFRAFAATLRLIGVAVFILIVVAGIVGVQSPLRNVAPVLVWVVWWVGLVFASALVGNVWALLDPWRTLFVAARFLSGARAGEGRRRYPQWLAAWPAVAIFLVFAWIELISESGEKPATLACLIAVYSLLVWSGMALFGERAWLENAEPFSNVFDLYGRVAPLKIDQRSVRPRMPGTGLVADAPLPASRAAFTLVVLATVTFDGFMETPAWVMVAGLFGPAGVVPGQLLKTVALLGFPILFAAIYYAFCAAAARLSSRRLSTAELGNALVLSLVPIALAYHVAHYLSYLLLAGQLTIPLASDPFGWGWNLFGTAGRSIDITIINAKTVWYVAVAAIVIGHMLAVYVAHVTALRLYSEPALAMRSQIPMLVLMVLYTMTSLWILSQPIVSG